MYEAASSATGNFTLSQLPTGTYEISSTVAGFKGYVRRNLVLGVAQTLRVDIVLEVGANSDSITITESASLLKTESGELSHNVTARRLDDLPVLSIGAAAGTAGIRNPAAVTLLLPGATYTGNALIRVNGAQGNTNNFRIEGQDASNGFLAGLNQQTQPSVDAIQEISVQTSNYAPEFGQVGGGYFNLTMKSGSNQFHGSAYDYFVNEVLNAGTPFTNNGRGGLIRPVQRRNDYGFTLGGPVAIPKLYNGHDRTFFFFNWEQYRETQNINNQAITVPTAAYRAGNFSAALTGRTLATDPLGRAIMENTIYDPGTQRLAPNGQLIRDPFPGNAFPASQMDPVALKIQALIPLPTRPGLVNNAIFPYLSQRVTDIPALKIDHSISLKAKLSFYGSRTSTESPFAPGSANADGLPVPVTQARGTYIYSQNERLNFDYSLTPTLLLHLGAGYTDDDFNAPAPISNYNAAQELGLTGTPVAVRQFPNFSGLQAPLGGMKNMGPNGVTGSVTSNYMSKPTGTASLTWVKANHTYKAGAEARFEGYIGHIYTNATGSFAFSANETGLPSTNGQNLSGGSVGFPYASFLLGAVDTVNVTSPIIFRLAKQQWGMFVQDSWKITRKLTLDYGLRYDYSTYLKEEYGRVLNFSKITANPTAGGHLGAVIFEGAGPGRCGCEFAHNYPLALAPRLGLAYQINPKTVLRAGWGIVYSGTEDGNGAVNTLPVTSPTGSPTFGQPAMLLRNGIPIPPSQYMWPNFNPGQFPNGSALNAPPVAIDQNAGRPARQNQWSIGVQREILRDLVAEASYVGNRGAWWISPGLINMNALTPQILANYGLNVNNSADRTLLTSLLNSSTATSRGFNNPAYPGFPLTTTVAQSLRPYPQFGAITYWWSPLGKTWYDSLQVKATQRFSHGLSFTSVFSWQKQLVLGSSNNPLAGTSSGGYNDVFNRGLNKSISQYDQPFVFNISLNYTSPKVGRNKALSWAVRDWTLGTLLQYASGMPIQSPAAQNSLSTVLFQSTLADRAPGVPLFTKDINCHCFDPNKTFVLNPAAWTDPPAGQFGTAAPFYSDYRYQRRPMENVGVGRTFRIHETATINIRAEFTNVLNRTGMNNPTATNAKATQTVGPSGNNVAGFGWIDTSSVLFPARQGTIVGRFTF
ncbi:MAG TPA: TonB-dependent receptor [Bryobacteraceae bacterium]